MKICIICDMLCRNRPHEISMCLDLTLETVVTVTDVIGYEYAHRPRQLELLQLVTSAEMKSSKDMKPGLTLLTWLYLASVLVQELSENKKLLHWNNFLSLKFALRSVCIYELCQTEHVINTSDKLPLFNPLMWFWKWTGGSLTTMSPSLIE